jgi:predicted RNA-binding Zn ribbon-like protein
VPLTQLPAAHVQLLLAFTNSVDHDDGTDDLTAPSDLRGWLAGHGLLAPRARVTEADLVLARALRDALHDALVANHDGRDDVRGLEALGDRLQMRIANGAAGPVLVPTQDGVRGALTQVLVAVHSAVADGTWERLKICSADDCEWAYFDASKNRSRSWCEWGCGNKAKTRSYRARRKAAVAG